MFSMCLHYVQDLISICLRNLFNQISDCASRRDTVIFASGVNGLTMPIYMVQNELEQIQIHFTSETNNISKCVEATS